MIKIYGLSCSDNPDKILYIGKTVQSLKRRLFQHKYQSLYNQRHNKKLTKVHSWILNKLSSSYEILITEIDNVDEDLWEFYETQYIKLFKSFGANLKNTASGGLSIYEKGEKLNFKRPIGKDSPTFKKLRKPQDKKVIPKDALFHKRVAMIDINTGKVIRYFSGSNRAAAFLGCSLNGLMKCCSNKNYCDTYYGYRWEYVDKIKYIKKLDKNGNIVGEYDTYLNAGKSVGINNHKGVYMAVLSGKPYRGFYWRTEKIIEE